MHMLIINPMNWQQHLSHHTNIDIVNERMAARGEWQPGQRISVASLVEPDALAAAEKILPFLLMEQEAQARMARSSMQAQLLTEMCYSSFSSY